MIKSCNTTISSKTLAVTRLVRFARDEGGAVIYLSLLFLFLMLIMTGMAVDFMRFESRRTMLQSVTDRAVLAAADLDQDKDAKEVVIDFFEKAGYSEDNILDIDVIDLKDFNSVGVTARKDINTIYLRMLDQYVLSAPAAATALEGVSNVEVSLVVDISGSMRDPVTPADGSTSTKTKIQALREAAKTFAETVLTDKFKDKISMSFVPYSEHVNAGPDLMTAMSTPRVHNWSHCMEFASSDFSKTGLNVPGNYPQMQHFQWNPDVRDGWYQNTVVDTVCPQYDYERIVPLTQNLSALTTQIDKLQPRAGTSIFLGLKWGLALLDRSMQPAVSNLISQGAVDTAFSGRPVAYPQDGEAADTQKIIVLMTDGENDKSMRLQDSVYSTANHYAHWASHNFQYFRYREIANENDANWFYQKYDKTTGDRYMGQLCDLAKENGVIIYTVAVEATANGQKEMAKCASSNAHFFNASGADLETIFGAIAKQITELRLSL